MVDDNIRFDIRARDRSGPAFASVDRSLQRTARSLVAIGRAGTAAFAAFGGAAVLRTVKRTVDAVAAIGDTADRVNVAAEALQAYRFALEENGGQARQMDDSLQRLNRRLGLAADGAGPAVRAFERLGIEVRDANDEVRDVDPVFREAVDRLSRIETEAERAALASQLFGEDAGPKLVPLISQGVAGLERYEQQARDLGIVLSEDLVDAAQETSREFARLVDQMTVKFQQFVVGTVGFGKSVIEALSPEEAPGLVETIEQLKAVMGSLQVSLERVESGPPSGRGRIREISDQIAAAKAEAESLEGFLRLVERQRGTGGGPGASPVVPGAGADAGFTTQSQRVVEALEFQRAQLGRTNTEQRIYNELRAAGVEIDSAAGERIRALASEIEAVTEAEAAANAATREANATTLEAERIYKATRTPAEAYAIEVARLNALLKDNVIDEELHGRAVEQAADKMDRATEKTRGLANVIDDELGRAIGGSIEDYKDWKRIALQAIGAIISDTLRLRAVQGTTGAGGGAAGGGGSIGGLITAGIGFVTGLFGQHGLSFTVGGAGGPDSQFVPLMLSPNEQVDVSTPQQVRQRERRGAGGVMIVQNIDARGADPQSAANLRATARKLQDDTVRAIIDASNQGGAVAYALGRRRR